MPTARRVVRGALLPALLLLAACARVPYTPAPLARDAAPAARAQARLDDPAHGALLARHAPDLPWPPAAWSCRELGLVAAARSRALAAARARLHAAAAARGVAGQRPNPRIGLDLQYNSDKDPGDDSHYSIGPSFSWLWSPVDRGRIRVALVDAQIVIARTALLEAAWTARERACHAASELVAARAAYRAREREAAILEAAVTLAHARVAAGVSDAFEWQSLTLEANGARLDRLDRLARVSVSGAELAAALGLAPAALGTLALTTRDADRDVPPLAALRTHALGHHPRILAALAAYDEAEHDLELAVAAQYPDIELSPGYFFDQGDHVWSLLGGIVVPLFATHDAAIAAAAARRDAARAAFEGVQEDIIAGLEQAWTAWQAERALHAVLDETAAAVESSVADFAQRQHDGLDDGLMLKRAELQHAQVALRAVVVGAARRRALLALERAAALPLADPAFAGYLDTLYREPLSSEEAR
ncbi:MAG: TolC family protein [Gammaproteobacteria bacterium]